ncbi:hypothetical protein MLP_39560 [Microlunatus phosphovorus NM-1]|uniref:Uncharacterized protein n=1 Tax=Microlunatus phosphovorus (strain ATCC 700054 / DSM 10555 / JCM 9379 / NBRC 101784 / NCIMB 13414 / VKM Ac-1990 / NM-1) TaxID=1032480 RepID=F5XQU8_MICPN|nr:hypothetical protein MLP_39560 [Microlunatus phosphovorus NM-1]
MTADTPPEAYQALVRSLELQIDLTAIVARGGGIERLLRGWQQQTGEPVAAFHRLGHIGTGSSSVWSAPTHDAHYGSTDSRCHWESASLSPRGTRPGACSRPASPSRRVAGWAPRSSTWTAPPTNS